MTFHSLSFEEGNLIWYESLPRHVLKAKERYQSEHKLEYVLRDQPDSVNGPELAPILMQNRRTRAYVAALTRLSSLLVT